MNSKIFAIFLVMALFAVAASAFGEYFQFLNQWGIKSEFFWFKIVKDENESSSKTLWGLPSFVTFNY